MFRVTLVTLVTLVQPGRSDQQLILTGTFAAGEKCEEVELLSPPAPPLGGAGDRCHPGGVCLWKRRPLTLQIACFLE